MSTAYALSGTNLIAFDSANPAFGTTTAISGLSAGETLAAIDFRPQNGILYGLGVTATGAGTLYAISARTGIAAVVGSAGGVALVDTGGNAIVLPDPATTGYGFDFNPNIDRIRVTTDTGLNFRINPNTGAPVDSDVTANGINPDGAINGGTTTVDGAAYTNNQPNSTVTTLYTLDAPTDRLFIQNPPNDGTQTLGITVTLNGSTLDFTSVNGFDIAAGINASSNSAVTSGSGLALLTVGGTTGLYSIDLTTGAATLAGDFLNGSTPASGLAIQNDLGGIPAIGLSADGSSLIRFNTATPGTTVGPVPITGIEIFERLVAIDFRPQTGQLYAFGVVALTDTGTLYRVDPQTGAATVVGSPGGIAFVDAVGNPIDLPDPATAGYGMDFNPAVDRIRITTDTGLNFRINPNNGAAVDGDATANGINLDGSINGLPPGSTGVAAAAYTNSYGQPLIGGVTTLYTLDATADTLFIQNPANAGTQTSGVVVTLGGNPLDFTSISGFDIPANVSVTTANAPAAGFGYAALTVAGTTSLYQIDLMTGVATNLGAIGPGAVGLAGLTLADLADAPDTIQLAGTSADDFFTAPDGGARIDALGGIDTITFGFNLVDATVSYAGNTGRPRWPGRQPHGADRIRALRVH